MNDGSPRTNDPLIEAELDRATKQYVGVLPPELLEQMREHLADALTTHPIGSVLLERTRPAPVVVMSGEAERGESETVTVDVAPAAAGGDTR